jgi:hypothetical protein
MLATKAATEFLYTFYVGGQVEAKEQSPVGVVSGFSSNGGFSSAKYV